MSVAATRAAGDAKLQSVHEQYAHAPKCARAQHRYKSYADHSSREATLAPALEHSHDSNEEQHKGEYAQTLQPHSLPLPFMFVEMQ